MSRRKTVTFKFPSPQAESLLALSRLQFVPLAAPLANNDRDYWSEYDNEQTIIVTWSNPCCVSIHPPTYYRTDGKALICMVFHNGRNNAPDVTVIRPAGRRAVLRAEDFPPCCIEHV